MRKPLVGLAVVLALVVGLVGLSAGVSAQTVGDVETRDRLIADQENLLNAYRCNYDTDTGLVPGGCGDPDEIAPGPAPASPTQQDIEARDGLISAQEELLNVYRCRFDVDTELVPDRCRPPFAPTTAFFQEWLRIEQERDRYYELDPPQRHSPEGQAIWLELRQEEAALYGCEVGGPNNTPPCVGAPEVVDGAPTEEQFVVTAHSCPRGWVLSGFRTGNYMCWHPDHPDFGRDHYPDTRADNFAAWTAEDWEREWDDHRHPSWAPNLRRLSP